MPADLLSETSFHERDLKRGPLDVSRTSAQMIEGIHCVAVPIFSAEGEVAASICVNGPARRIPVKADPRSLHRLIAWADACCPFLGEDEFRALGDPEFPGIEGQPIRPRVATAPVMERP